ncbi:MAG TPA: phosphoribosylaminoimidazolesuccinocarboxamide synthase [Gemmatimonadaceae bacterium]|jgi:phosphoribosylaminoimidazole-succinocarboxamide synthase|nr:phosphoribosylaminoimidazolesuccinocarboxamide synthase [Gemmatimonadaceae bacterium]
MTPMVSSNLPLRRIGRGKVRDIYEIDASRILLVATDRVSAFDVVMRETIPFKGAVLTQLSAWWFAQVADIVSTHLITARTSDIVRLVPGLASFRQAIAGRSMLCRRAAVFPIECVIRGYISGSAWKEYAKSGTLAGEPLPAGLRESDRLAEPIFSPATKAETGHDENITVRRMRQIVGEDLGVELERLTRAVFARGSAIAEDRGIIVADTKLEFGRAPDESIVLIDELLTPDSSRFWPADSYKPGGSQPSFDKQPLRDYLDSERRAGRWNGEAPAPPLPDEVVRATSARYLDAFRRLTGESLDVSDRQ